MALSFRLSSPLTSFPVKNLTEIWQRYAGFAMRIDAAKARLAFCKRSWPTATGQHQHSSWITVALWRSWPKHGHCMILLQVLWLMYDWWWLMWVIHWDTNGILVHFEVGKVSSCARFWICLNCGFLMIFVFVLSIEITDLRAPITGHNPDNITEKITHVADEIDWIPNFFSLFNDEFSSLHQKETSTSKEISEVVPRLPSDCHQKKQLLPRLPFWFSPRVATVSPDPKCLCSEIFRVQVQQFLQLVGCLEPRKLERPGVSVV